MAIKKSHKGSFFDKKEILDRKTREENLFEHINIQFKKITELSSGWKSILKNVDIGKIRSRKDLAYIPITRKSSLAELQKKNFPYGNLNTKHYSKFPFMFASPGPIYEPGDLNDFWNMSRALYAAGLRSEDISYNTFSYHLGPAGIMMHQAANNLGSTVIAGGVGNTDLQIETIKNLSPSFYIGTPSFLKIILEKAKKNNIYISTIKKALVGAEPLPTSLRKYLLSLGVEVMQMYGIAEVGCIAYETKNENNILSNGMIVEEDIILEIVRPGTTKPLPPGEVGEVVVTKINTDYPILRLGTGDLSKVIDEPSPCGRTNYRIQGWMGRAEQTTKLKGIFVTPKQINSITKIFKNIHKTRLVINTKDFLDRGELLCETEIEDKELSKKIKLYFKENFKLNIEISLVKKNIISNDGLVIEDKRVLD